MAAPAVLDDSLGDALVVGEDPELVVAWVVCVLAGALEPALVVAEEAGAVLALVADAAVLQIEISDSNKVGRWNIQYGPGSTSRRSGATGAAGALGKDIVRVGLADHLGKGDEGLLVCGGGAASGDAARYVVDEALGRADALWGREAVVRGALSAVEELGDAGLLRHRQLGCLVHFRLVHSDRAARVWSTEAAREREKRSFETYRACWETTQVLSEYIAQERRSAGEEDC